MRPVLLGPTPDSGRYPRRRLPMRVATTAFYLLALVALPLLAVGGAAEEPDGFDCCLLAKNRKRWVIPILTFINTCKCQLRSGLAAEKESRLQANSLSPNCAQAYVGLVRLWG